MYIMGYVSFHSHQMGARDTVLEVNAHFSPSSLINCVQIHIHFFLTPTRRHSTSNFSYCHKTVQSTFADTTIQTRTKYLKRHQGEVMHGPLPAEVAASLLSYSSASTSRVTPLSSRLDSTTRQLDREDGTAISGRNDSTGSRTNQPLHSLFAMNHATSSTAVIEYLDKLDKLPDCGKRERIEKRKRTLEALDYLESEMRRLRLNDHKMYDAWDKHRMKAYMEDVRSLYGLDEHVSLVPRQFWVAKFSGSYHTRCD